MQLPEMLSISGICLVHDSVRDHVFCLQMYFSYESQSVYIAYHVK